MKWSVLQYRSLSLLLLLGLACPKVGFARSWKGVTPGVTTRNEIIKKIGVPSQELTRGSGENGLLYQGKTAPEGTKQVQVFFDQNSVATTIHVFPKTDLTREQIIQTYGKPSIERLNDSFKTYFYYKDEGIVVYFKEGNQGVASITYQKPSHVVPPGEEAEAKGDDAVAPSPSPQPKSEAPASKAAGHMKKTTASPSPASAPNPPAKP